MIKIYMYILVAGIVSTIIRVLPVTIFRKPIKSRFVRSFLYYVPYVTLAVMTFPAIVDATQSKLSGILALACGTVAAWLNQSLFRVAIICCLVVFISELVLIYHLFLFVKKMCRILMFYHRILYFKQILMLIISKYSKYA